MNKKSNFSERAKFLFISPDLFIIIATSYFGGATAIIATEIIEVSKLHLDNHCLIFMFYMLYAFSFFLGLRSIFIVIRWKYYIQNTIETMSEEPLYEKLKIEETAKKFIISVLLELEHRSKIPAETNGTIKTPSSFQIYSRIIYAFIFLVIPTPLVMIAQGIWIPL